MWLNHNAELIDVVSVTGHRPQSLDGDFDYKSTLWQGITKFYQTAFCFYEPSMVLSGMALGVDTVVARCAVDMEIPFTACIPMRSQPSRWNKKAVARYEWLLERATQIIYVDEEQANEEAHFAVKMQKRNEYMVDNSDLLLGTWDGTKRGGTFNCINYAKNIGKPVEVYRIDSKENNRHGHQAVH